MGWVFSPADFADSGAVHRSEHSRFPTGYPQTAANEKASIRPKLRSDVPIQQSILQTSTLSTVFPSTVTQGIVGTPGYIAPEVIEGRRADPRSDIFAVGCILYELLTGNRVFDGRNIQAVLRATAICDPDTVKVAPRELDALIRQCILKDPTQRPQTATQD
jgi:serine/threonine protein kinase